MRRTKLTRDLSESKTSANSLPSLTGSASIGSSSTVASPTVTPRKPASRPNKSTKNGVTGATGSNNKLNSKHRQQSVKGASASVGDVSESTQSYLSVNGDLDSSIDAPLTPQDDATGDEIEEEETLRRSIARAPRSHPVWSFHPSRDDGAIETTSEIPENYEFDVDAEARAILAASDETYEADWTTEEPTTPTPVPSKPTKSRRKDVSDTVDTASNQSTDAAATQPTVLATPTPTTPSSIHASSDAPISTRKSSLSTAGSPPKPRRTLSIREPESDSPSKVSRPLSVASSSPSLSTSTFNVAPVHHSSESAARSRPLSSRAHLNTGAAATTTGVTHHQHSPNDTDRSFRTPTSVATATTKPTSTATTATVPTVASLQQQLSHVQTELSQALNQLSAKNLRLKTLQKEKEHVSEELVQVRQELEKSRSAATTNATGVTRSASVTSMTSDQSALSTTTSLLKHHHRSHFQQKRLLATQEELSRMKMKLNKLSLALDSSRRRLRLKLSKDLPPNIVRTLKNQRALIQELQIQLAASQGEDTRVDAMDGNSTNVVDGAVNNDGGSGVSVGVKNPSKLQILRQQLLDSQHTIHEQSTLLDSLHEELSRLTKERNQLLRDHDSGRPLESQSQFYHVTQIANIENEQQQQQIQSRNEKNNNNNKSNLTHTNVPNESDNASDDDVDPLADDADSDGDDGATGGPSSPGASVSPPLRLSRMPSTDLETVRRILAHSAISPPAAAENNDDDTAGDVQIGTTISKQTTTNTTNVDRTALPTPLVSDPSSHHQLSSRLASVESTLLSERVTSSNELARLSEDVRTKGILLEQYQLRHHLSDRLAKEQYHQLVTLTKEYHERGEIIFRLTNKLRTCQEESDWLRQELQVFKTHTKEVVDGVGGEDGVIDSSDAYEPIDPEEERKWEEEVEREWKEVQQQQEAKRKELEQRKEQHQQQQQHSHLAFTSHLPSIEERKEELTPAASPTHRSHTPHEEQPRRHQHQQQQQHPPPPIHLLHHPSSSSSSLPSATSATLLPTIASMFTPSHQQTPTTTYHRPTSAMRSGAGGAHASPHATPHQPSSGVNNHTMPPSSSNQATRVSHLLLQSLAHTHGSVLPSYPAGFTPPGKSIPPVVPAPAPSSPSSNSHTPRRTYRPSNHMHATGGSATSTQRGDVHPDTAALASVTLANRGSGSWKDYQDKRQQQQSTNTSMR